MPSKKIRVSELAKELGLPPRVTLSLSESMGITVKSISSTMEDAQADRIRRKAKRDGLGVFASSSVPPQPLIEEKNSKNSRKGQGGKNQPTAKDRSTSLVRLRPRWPNPAMYDDSLFDPGNWFRSDDLKLMQVEPAGPMGQSSIFQTGGFACVAKAEIAGSRWAVRLLYRQQIDLEARYQAIETRQRQGQLLDFMVPVRYRDDEVTVRGIEDQFPVVLVQWIDGKSLSVALREACATSDVTTIRRIRAAFRELESSMRRHNVAHGDLSGDNILVIAIPEGFRLVLVDYDSLWLSEIAELRSSVGDSDLQHPGMRKRRSPSIGPYADCFAFRLYELGLLTLEKHPELGVLPELYEHKFLVSRSEIETLGSGLARAMNAGFPELFNQLLKIMHYDYDNLVDLIGVNGQPGEIEGVTQNVGIEPRVTLAQIVNQLDISVVEARRRLAAMDIAEDPILEGISVKTLIEAFGGEIVSKVFGVTAASSSREPAVELDWSEVAKLKVSQAFFEAVLVDVLGAPIREIKSRRLTQEDLDLALARIKMDRLQYPVALQSLAWELEISQDLLRKRLKIGEFVERPYGIFLSETAARSLRAVSVLRDIASDYRLTLAEITDLAEEGGLLGPDGQVDPAKTNQLRTIAIEFLDLFPHRIVDVATELRVSKVAVELALRGIPEMVQYRPSGGRMTSQARRALVSEFGGANQSASQVLLPQIRINDLATKLGISEDDVRHFAREIAQIPPEATSISEWIANQVPQRVEAVERDFPVRLADLATELKVSREELETLLIPGVDVVLRRPYGDRTTVETRTRIVLRHSAGRT